MVYTRRRRREIEHSEEGVKGDLELNNPGDNSETRLVDGCALNVPTHLVVDTRTSGYIPQSKILD